MKNCTNCQAPNDADAKFCNSCGKPLSAGPPSASSRGADPSKINVLVLSANRQRQAVLASSPDVLESEIAYLFVLYNRAYGFQYSFLGDTKGNDPYQEACTRVDQAALVILQVDEKFLASSSCLDLSERLVERYHKGEDVRILAILKKKDLKIDQTPFSGFGTVTLDSSKALAKSFQLACVLLACNNDYLGEMSLYGWLLQRLALDEPRSKEFVVDRSILTQTGSSWSTKEFTLYKGQQCVDTFEFGKITDSDVNRLSIALGAVDGQPHFVQGIAQ